MLIKLLSLTMSQRDMTVIMDRVTFPRTLFLNELFSPLGGGGGGAQLTRFLQATRSSVSSTPHPSSALSIPLHRPTTALLGAQLTRFLQATRSSVSSTPHPSSALSIPLHHPTTALLAFLVIFLPQLCPARNDA